MAGMTLGEIKSYINRHLGFYDKKQTDIAAEIVAAQRSLEGGVHLPGKAGGTFKPWFLVSEVQTALAVVNEDRVPVPTSITGTHDGFLSEHENASLWVVDADEFAADPTIVWDEILKDDFDVIQKAYPGTGKPLFYAASGNYFRLRPFPDKAWMLKIITHNADLIVTSDSGTNKWMTYAPLLLAAKAGRSMAGALRDAAARLDFSETLAEETLNLFTATEARLHENHRIVMGGED